jgi:hypothetical protein
MGPSRNAVEATFSSVYSMLLFWQTVASSSPATFGSSGLILRDASLTSVSPAQKAAKPGPVPGPSTVKPKSGLSALNASDTACEMGCTVDEPETWISPETLPEPAGRSYRRGRWRARRSGAGRPGRRACRRGRSGRRWRGAAAACPHHERGRDGKAGERLTDSHQGFSCLEPRPFPGAQHETCWVRDEC